MLIIIQNNPIDNLDYFGYFSLFSVFSATMNGIKRAFDYIRLGIQYTGGFLVSVGSGDIFWPRDDAKFSDIGCEFLITINGIWNTKGQRERFNNKITDLPIFAKIKKEQNSVHLHNPTTFIGDFVQIIGDEIGLINITSIMAAKYIDAAGLQAEKNHCDCFTIHVVAHSQGTSVFYRALPLIQGKYKDKIHFIGLGGQRLATPKWDIGTYHNHINVDIVPLLNFINPLHFFDGISALSDAESESDFHNENGIFPLLAHPWEDNYLQYL